MAPIRVGFIGLSATPGGWGERAHLPYLQHTKDYLVVAVCNSSVESAKAAIEFHKLPLSAKAYGDPEDLAKDKNVELVVCSVRVDKHFPTVAPSLKAGKDVFVEWPLGKNYEEAKEFLRLKNDGGVKRAVVGLQAREAPVIKTLKRVLADGRIGKVLNSTYVAQAGNLGRTTLEKYAYLRHREIGANLVTIHFGHSIDYVQQVLGYGFKRGPKSLLANTRPSIKILNDKGDLLEEATDKTSDDTIFVHGVLSSGVALSLSLRSDEPFKGTPGLVWSIYGEKGEVRVTAAAPFLQIGYPDMKISLFDMDNDVVEDVEIEKDDFDDALPQPACNVARLYNGFAGKGDFVGCTFEDAVERHALIAQLYEENGIKV